MKTKADTVRLPSVPLIVGCMLCSMAARADDWPTRPVTLVVPFAPGGATDIPARLVAPKLADALGQQVVIENRTGAGGIIGLQAFIDAPQDGTR